MKLWQEHYRLTNVLFLLTINLFDVCLTDKRPIHGLCES